MADQEKVAELSAAFDDTFELIRLLVKQVMPSEPVGSFGDAEDFHDGLYRIPAHVYKKFGKQMANMEKRVRAILTR